MKIDVSRNRNIAISRAPSVPELRVNLHLGSNASNAGMSRVYDPDADAGEVTLPSDVNRVVASE